jgi:DMATS type aromatic prenyltransferase
MTKIEAIATELKSSKLADLLSAQLQIERTSQVGFNPEELGAEFTYAEAGIEKLTALCDAVGMNDKTDRAIEIFRVMTASWRNKKVLKNCPNTNLDPSSWQSNVSDDGAPFEFSIALDPKQTEIRVLVEAQGSNPNLRSNWEAGIELNQQLAEHYHVNLDRFRQIEDLFVPTDTDAKFSMWHSACFYPDKEPAFKLYLNLQSQGRSKAAAIFEESLVRLGFSRVWSALAEIAAQRGPDKDEFVYFALDLASHPKARVKAYIRHHDATVDDLEQALSVAQNYVPGDVTEFCQAMSDGQKVFAAKPAISCFSLIEGDDETPSNGTVYLPISNYAPNDRVVRDRLDRYFTQHGIPVSTYNLAIQSVASRPLEAGIGMQSYISFRRENQQQRLAIYLNPEVNAVQPPRKTLTAPSVKSLASLEETIWQYEERTVADHPFLQRLQREEVSPQLIWLLFMNVREAVANHFTRRLANIIARIDDERIRCVLAKQLNEELGNGDIDRIHRKLFDRLMEAIDPWRMASFTEEMLSPGKELSRRLEEIYLDADAYVGIGAAIVMEIHGKQFDLCLGREFRKTNVDLAEISWLVIHEELEIGHADEALILARFVADSAAGVPAAMEGANQTRLASWKFLDDLYRLCFS